MTKRLHGVLIDIPGDRLALGIADVDCAWVVHATPNSSLVTVRARLRDAGIGAARLTGGRQGEGLLGREVAEQNGRSCTVEAGVPGRVFRVRRGGDEWQPVRIGDGIRIAVGVCQRD